jgi:fructose-1,6-bisphosphatase/inositol monophosphatase family enzyme
MTPSPRGLLAALEREVRACRPLALRYFRSPHLRVERKADASPVTAADRALEERLRRVLRRLAPGETILGEEFGRSGAPGATYWTVDPIDGTRAFASGLPSWGIMVGRVERGRATLGVIDYPVIGTTLSVAPGVRASEIQGARRAPLPRGRAVAGLREAVVFHGGWRWWPRGGHHRGFTRLVQGCFLERAYGDCYGYLWALRGRVDAVIDNGVKPWDLVPLAALAGATGRVLADFSGRPNFLGPETIMAHPAVVRMVVRCLSGR